MARNLRVSSRKKQEVCQGKKCSKKHDGGIEPVLRNSIKADSFLDRPCFFNTCLITEPRTISITLQIKDRRHADHGQLPNDRPTDHGIALRCWV